MKLIGNLLISSFDEFDFESLNDEILEEISEDLSDNFLENNIIEENKNFIIKTKIYRFDENGKKINEKGTYEKIRKYEKNRDKDKHVYVFRELDREHNTYSEIIKSKENKTIHECSEPLTNHTNHGTAKTSK